MNLPSWTQCLNWQRKLKSERSRCVNWMRKFRWHRERSVPVYESSRDSMTTPMACCFCHWWKREVTPSEREWGTCTLANQPRGDFQVLIVINSSWDEENTVVLRTRDAFYCAKFRQVQASSS